MSQQDPATGADPQARPTPDDFPGFFPTVLWVGVGVFLFWTTPGASFLSWQALVYFLFGVIAVGIVFSILALTVRRLIPALNPARAATASPGVKLLGTLVGATQLVIVYFLAKAVIAQLFG